MTIAIEQSPVEFPPVAVPVRAPEPQWWTGTPSIDPSRYVIDCADPASSVSDASSDGPLADRMRQIFRDVGLVHLVNTGLTDLGRMREIAKFIVAAEMEYKGGANPRDSLQPNVYEIGAPLTAWLHYHHEMAYVGKSTKMLGFLCRKAVPGKGQTFVSDNIRATEALLDTAFGQRLKRFGLCYHRHLTDREAFTGREEVGVYNHWQKSMLTDDPAEAEAAARERGLITEWGPDRLLKTRYYISAFEYFPPLDRNLLFSSIADDSVWFDAWPKVMHLPHDQRPLKLTLGNDEEITTEDVRTFMEIYDRFGTPIDWEVGDIAVVCNYRFAHGRPAIHLEPGEERELGVVIGETFDRVETLADKW